MKPITLWLICAFLISIVHGSLKIYNGEPVNEHIPFIVSLKIPNDLCGGSILNERFILTAAHCFWFAKECEDIIVGAGSNILDAPLQQRKTPFHRDQYVPPTFDAKGKCLFSDLRIVDLGAGNELIFDGTVSPALLDTNGPTVGASVTFAGWGIRNENSPHSQKLFKTTEIIQDYKTCPITDENFLHCTPNESSGQFCAWNEKSISCPGDSGSPVFYVANDKSKIVTGVVSATTAYEKKTCLQPGQKDLHTSVAKHTNWIIEYTNQNTLYGWGRMDDHFLFWRENPSQDDSLTNPKIIKMNPSEGVMPILRKLRPTKGKFALGISASNRLYLWGRGNQYQLGNGKNSDILHPTVHNFVLENILDACGGYSHSLALSTDGKVYEWGTLADAIKKTPTVVVFPNNDKIKSISCGHSHNLAVSQDMKRLYFWGKNQYGEGGNIKGACASNPKAFIERPILISIDNNDFTIISICAGDSTSYEVTSKGHVYSWGYNEQSLLGTGISSICIGIPTKISVENAERMYCGDQMCFVKAVNNVYGWGINKFNEIDESGLPIISPIITNIESASDITIGNDFVLYKISDSWYGKGNNYMVSGPSNFNKGVDIECTNYYCFVFGQSVKLRIDVTFKYNQNYGLFESGLGDYEILLILFSLYTPVVLRNRNKRNGGRKRSF
ncbi:predicted protein [Naegleria gruberi]|uniref:Predicted protein n=1 Tax=Naegleria gruberi TaxID=5762 RepID=D2VXY5_NAEGR|nr:uncharacterized protein NAEGRDRAFT_74003 [Naegleria gruberi]EFC38276.1 predicted protein [Naegleria gruberi]|eukprot:XP_002671020.1 predicted protein [Naegleria gruberi strain NEG-M]